MTRLPMADAAAEAVAAKAGFDFQLPWLTTADVRHTFYKSLI
jgi:hypothetical protein